jgi:hypothetical protein
MGETMHAAILGDNAFYRQTPQEKNGAPLIRRAVLFCNVSR